MQHNIYIGDADSMSWLNPLVVAVASKVKIDGLPVLVRPHNNYFIEGRILKFPRYLAGTEHSGM